MVSRSLYLDMLADAPRNEAYSRCLPALLSLIIGHGLVRTCLRAKRTACAAWLTLLLL